MRLELFNVSRQWPRQHTQSDDEVSFVNSRIFLLPSVQFVDLILPSNSHAEIWTRLHAPAISSDIWRSGCVTSAIFGMACVIVIERKYLSCSSQVTLFRCITLKWDLHLVPYYQPSSPARFLSIIGHWDVLLPLSLEWPVWSSSSGNNCHAVHRSLSSGASLWSGTFTLSHIISRAHLRDFFRLLAIGMCHFRYLRNFRCDRHRAEITIMQFIGQSLPAHHFFYGTVRILWAKLYFTSLFNGISTFGKTILIEEHTHTHTHTHTYIYIYIYIVKLTYCLSTFLLTGSKHSNNNGRSVLTAKRTLFKNKRHLVEYN